MKTDTRYNKKIPPTHNKSLLYNDMHVPSVLPPSKKKKNITLQDDDHDNDGDHDETLKSSKKKRKHSFTYKHNNPLAAKICVSK